MFCYAATLVELGLVDSVNINFLIVGHTHDLLDQMFSVLSNAIGSAHYVLTPLAMQELIQTAHQNPAERPHMHVHLQFVYDYKTYYHSMYHTKFTYYNFPFRLISHPRTEFRLVIH